MARPLPIDKHLPAILDAVRAHRSAVVVAPPGAGKTTRVPPALLALGRVILLQPRRIAARSLAQRIADEQAWSVGEEVGWQVRFERRFSPRTRLLVATEGILTARFQSDPLLSEFAVAVIDEFHERGIHADLALALARQAARARGDLSIVVMSATLDAAPVSEFLEGCPVLHVPGRPHPITLQHAPGRAPADAVREVVRQQRGHVLVFLPGAPEIRRVEEELRGAALPGVLLPLHGSLDAESQDRALRPSEQRKIVLATNLAETSLTIDGVTDVVDSGLHKVLRYDPTLGIDRLETEKISRDSAEQRAGRAGRTGPGHALRLWDPREILRERRESEIGRIDLAAPFLDVLAWGGDPLHFEWFEAPPDERAQAALALLQALGAVSCGKLTKQGEMLRRFPLHPRLARVLVDAGGTREAAAVAAVLGERWSGARAGAESCDSDLVARADGIHEAPAHVRRVASELHALAARILGEDAVERSSPERLLRAIFAGYPDRVARRRERGSPKLLLASGHGATLARESGVRSGEWMVAVDVQAAPRGSASEALVRAASVIDRAWLPATRRSIDHELQAGVVRAFERAWHGALALSERPVPPDPIEAARLLALEVQRRGFSDEQRMLLARIRFAELSLDPDTWIERACAGRSALAEVDLAGALPGELRRSLERLAPDSIPLPSGRRARLLYREDGSVVASVKLQSVFGMGESPRVGPRRVSVTFELLAPSGRPVQTTRDLESFWERGYAEVRKELRARYPKHAWPEDPRRG